LPFFTLIDFIDQVIVGQWVVLFGALPFLS
jgi:hypothetical protein